MAQPRKYIVFWASVISGTFCASAGAAFWANAGAAINNATIANKNFFIMSKTPP